MKQLLKQETCERMKLTFPMASNPLSKKKTIPRKEKNIPKPVNPNPISVSCVNHIY